MCIRDRLGAWFERHGCVAAMVRPDNYVWGVAAAPGEVASLVDEAAQALGFAPVPA